MEPLHKRLAILFACLAFLVLAWKRANFIGAGTPGKFDHYILALQWPPSICRVKSCNSSLPKNFKDFTIHGLWPSNKTFPSPEFCNDTKLNSTEIEAIRNELEANWPNLFWDDFTFWSLEWSKHGTCSGLPQLRYFETALRLHAQVSVLTRLKGLDFHPDPNKTYNPSQIISKYQDEYNVTIKIKCVKNLSKEMISEINFQVKTDGKTVESITGSSNMCKTSEVAFPDKY